MNLIAKVLKEQGRTQRWLADKLGKSYNMTNSYVTNKRQPSLLVLNRIAEILQVDVKDLIQSNQQSIKSNGN